MAGRPSTGSLFGRLQRKWMRSNFCEAFLAEFCFRKPDRLLITSLHGTRESCRRELRMRVHFHHTEQECSVAVGGILTVQEGSLSCTGEPRAGSYD